MMPDDTPNTPTTGNEKMGEWRDLASAPLETPVIVEYRPFNYRKSPLRYEQVAWLYDGRWRTYPLTDGHAHADRWRPMPSAQLTAEAVREACAKYLDDRATEIEASSSNASVGAMMREIFRSEASAIRSMPLTEVDRG